MALRISRPRNSKQIDRLQLRTPIFGARFNNKSGCFLAKPPFLLRNFTKCMTSKRLMQHGKGSLCNRDQRSAIGSSDLGLLGPC